MAGSPPNFHKMDSRSACIQVVLKVKVKVKGHVIWATFLDSWNELLRHWRSGIKLATLKLYREHVSLLSPGQLVVTFDWSSGDKCIDPTLIFFEGGGCGSTLCSDLIHNSSTLVQTCVGGLVDRFVCLDESK